MAKLSDREEENLVSDWKTGRYSQRDLADKYNCSKGKVSQLTQGIEKAQNGHLVDCQISLLSANAYLSDSEMTAIMTTAQNEVFNKGLVTNATQLNLVRTTQYLAKNKKLEKRGVGDPGTAAQRQHRDHRAHRYAALGARDRIPRRGKKRGIGATARKIRKIAAASNWERGCAASLPHQRVLPKGLISGGVKHSRQSIFPNQQWSLSERRERPFSFPVLFGRENC